MGDDTSLSGRYAFETRGAAGLAGSSLSVCPDLPRWDLAGGGTAGVHGASCSDRLRTWLTRSGSRGMTSCPSVTSC